MVIFLADTHVTQSALPSPRTPFRFITLAAGSHPIRLQLESVRWLAVLGEILVIKASLDLEYIVRLHCWWQSNATSTSVHTVSRYDH